MNGTTNWLARLLHWAWFDRMMYRPFKGAHRGYWYRLPWNKGKF